VNTGIWKTKTKVIIFLPKTQKVGFKTLRTRALSTCVRTNRQTTSRTAAATTWGLKNEAQQLWRKQHSNMLRRQVGIVSRVAPAYPECARHF